MKKTSEKMGIKSGFRTIFIDAPSGIIESLELPDIKVSHQLIGEFDYIHFFAKNKATLENGFPLIKLHLKSNGMLWISWAKAGQNNTDLNLKKVINIGYANGLVESTTLSVNSVWSAMKFTHPKKGKTYNNSYGTLKLDDHLNDKKENEK